MSDRLTARGDRSSALLTLRILHAAMMASIGIYGMVLLMVTRAGPAGDPVPAAEVELHQPRGEPPGPIFTVVLALAAVATIAAIFFIRARALPRSGGKQDLFADSSAARAPARASRMEYFTLCILSWALAESIAVYGLVLGFLHHALLPFVPFAAVSLLVIAILAPRRGHIGGVAGSDGAG